MCCMDVFLKHICAYIRRTIIIIIIIIMIIIIIIMMLFPLWDAWRYPLAEY